MKHGRGRLRGFTLTELMVVCAVLAILAGVALPVAKTAVKREREIEFRRDLRLLREAIDVYKRLADEGKIEIEDESEGYPPDLETLVKGVEIQEDADAGSEGESSEDFGIPSSSASSDAGGSGTKRIKFLRRIPKDPMTNSTDWGLRSYQDAPDSTVWGKENVYDVYTKSQARALDGTYYRDW